MTKENPKVSIIIPCYNGEKFIGEAIESVLSQTHQNFEIIIVDDGSTDNSSGAIKPYLADGRIYYLCHRTNKGIAETRNSGIRRAQGKYVAFLDQDDIWLPPKLEEQLALFTTDKIGLVCCSMLFFDESGIIGLFNPKSVFSQEEVLKTLFITPTNSASVMLIKRACLDEVGWFDTSYIGWDDYEFLMRIATKFQINYTGAPLVKKRVHDSTTNILRKEALREEYLTRILNTVVQYHPFLKKHLPSKMREVYFNQALIAFEGGKTGKAVSFLNKSVMSDPFDLKIYALLMCVILGPFGKIVWNGLKHVKSLINRYDVRLVKYKKIRRRMRR